MARGADSLDIAELYRRYGDMVYGRCLSMLRNEADAVDATQDTFLKAHRYRDRFRGQSKPSTWLYRIATNTCLNVIRTRKRHPEDPVEDVGEVVRLQGRVGPRDGLLDDVAARDLVEQLLDGWDEKTRQCVVYHFVDGMTQAEVGALLGFSGAAVRKRLTKFKRVSRERFPDWPGWAEEGS